MPQVKSNVNDKVFDMVKDVDGKMQDISNSHYFANSDIHGTGTFASRDIDSKENIGVAIKTNGKISNLNEGENYIRTKLGRKVNHQFNNNSYLKKEDSNYNLYSSKKINKDSEITANYKDTPSFIDKNTDGFKELK